MTERDAQSAQYSEPQWAPRVPKAKIRRLYETDARGIYDESLIDEVGWALHARCESFLIVSQAVKGRAMCPQCGQLIPHQGKREDLLRCQGCGWQITWDRYFRSFQHRQLSGAEEVQDLFRRYTEDLPVAREPRQKMLLIDHLLHGFHYYAANQMHTRPVAVNLIDGQMTDVIAFLDDLTYRQGSSPGTRQTQQQWRDTMQATLRKWSQEMPKPPSRDGR